MNDGRRIPNDLPGTDDQALGEALGNAIREQVEAPAVRPPVAHIAERAAVQAKARTTRHTVVGIAASIALVAGGITAWNALNNNQATEVIVIDEPTFVPGPEPTAGPAPVPTSEPPEVSDDTPQASSGVSPEPPTPESLSTGSLPEWEEFDPATVFGADLLDVHSILSVGDGRVLVQAYGPDSNQVMVSENGVDWTVLTMPPDFGPERFDIAGDRWLVTGVGVDTTGAFDDHRAFFSDNQGATWTDLDIDIAGADETVSVAAVLVSGENMVIATEARVHADIASVIVGRGLVPDKDSIRGWMSVEGDTVSFTRDESSDPESFELTAEEEDFLYGGDRSFVRLYFSDGDAAELVAEYAAWDVAGYGAADGFHLTLLATEGEMMLTSADGRQWNQAPLATGDGVPVGRFYTYYGTTENTVWTSSQTTSEYRVERLDGVYTPAPVAEIPDGIDRVDRFSVGPAGIALVALPGSLPDTEILAAFKVTKDGYELRVDFAEGDISLWDLAEDTAVYQFGAENAQSSMLPEGVREVDGGDDGPDLLVFDDPETGEPLVSFTMEELTPWIDNSSFMSTEDTWFEQPEQWVGWSADGTDWVWQTLSDAFVLTDLTEIEKEFTNVELAVGSDFVIARVQTYSADPSDTSSDDTIMLSSHAPLWFIATVE